MKSGDKFSAIINGKRTYGVIQIENGKTFYCSNFPHAEGQECADRRGFKYSWVHDGLVRRVKIISKLPFKLPFSLKLTSDYSATIERKEVVVGCQRIPFKVVMELAKEVKKRMTKKK